MQVIGKHVGRHLRASVRRAAVSMVRSSAQKATQERRIVQRIRVFAGCVMTANKTFNLSAADNSLPATSRSSVRLSMRWYSSSTAHRGRTAFEVVVDQRQATCCVLRCGWRGSPCRSASSVEEYSLPVIGIRLAPQAKGCERSASTHGSRSRWLLPSGEHLALIIGTVVVGSAGGDRAWRTGLFWASCCRLGHLRLLDPRTVQRQGCLGRGNRRWRRHSRRPFPRLRDVQGRGNRRCGPSGLWRLSVSRRSSWRPLRAGSSSLSCCGQFRCTRQR